MMQRRETLIIVLAFNALSAICGGIALMAGFSRPPAAWLIHTPFNSYVLPGLLLALIVGGSALMAAAAELARKSAAHLLSLSAGIIMCIWIICEMFLIRQFSWLQILYLLLGGSVIGLAGIRSPAATRRDQA